MEYTNYKLGDKVMRKNSSDRKVGEIIEIIQHNSGALGKHPVGVKVRWSMKAYDNSSHYFRDVELAEPKVLTPEQLIIKEKVKEFNF